MSLPTQSSTQFLDKPSTLLDGIDLVLFDCDGVIWKGGSIIDGAKQLIETLRANGKLVKFVTNNALKSRVGFQKKFTDLGIDVPIDDMFSSSYAAAAYLAKNPMESHQKAYVIGHEGIFDELTAHNIPFVDSSSFGDRRFSYPNIKSIEQDKDVGAVIVGGDCDINFYKIQYAQLCLNQNKGCRFIATNTDRVAHLTSDQEWAEGGACVGAIQGCTETKAILVGKPSSFLIDHITETYKVDRARICMIGDNLMTDILFGLNNGLKTVLTLSGVTSEEAFLSGEKNIWPHYYVNSVKDLLA